MKSRILSQTDIISCLTTALHRLDTAGLEVMLSGANVDEQHALINHLAAARGLIVTVIERGMP